MGVAGDARFADVQPASSVVDAPLPLTFSATTAPPVTAPLVAAISAAGLPAIGTSSQFVPIVAVGAPAANVASCHVERASVAIFAPAPSSTFEAAIGAV